MANTPSWQQFSLLARLSFGFLGHPLLQLTFLFELLEFSLFEFLLEVGWKEKKKSEQVEKEINQKNHPHFLAKKGFFPFATRAASCLRFSPRNCSNCIRFFFGSQLIFLITRYRIPISFCALPDWVVYQPESTWLAAHCPGPLL